MARQRMVAGNWKLNGSVQQVDSFAQELVEGLPAAALSADLLVCPPFVYLAQMRDLFQHSNVALGAQDVCEQAGPGAFTGEVSAAMLADIGCTHVLVGHSERRQFYGDTDAVVAAKFIAALEAGLTPVLCVGETLDQRESSETPHVLRQQLSAIFEACGARTFAQAIIAYEPVWAIGTGRTATPEQAQDVHAFLRAQIASENATIADQVSILYGGSVKPDNAAELFSCEDVDGGLIGGASLQASSLLDIASV